jgi:hypothetical protein
VAGDEALRMELLRMAEEDQAARRALDWGRLSVEDREALERLQGVDERNIARIREIVRSMGGRGRPWWGKTEPRRPGS